MMICADASSFSSSISVANAFQLFQPIGGSCAAPRLLAVQRPVGDKVSAAAGVASAIKAAAPYNRAANFPRPFKLEIFFIAFGMFRTPGAG